MRRYNIVFGILLILPIIDFALAAPVLVQGKCQACADVVHITKDVITVLEKRGGGEIEKVAEDYVKTWGKPADSSGAHVSSSSAPSSSAPPGPNHGSTNVVQAPAPNSLNPVSSTAYPDHVLMELSSPEPAFDWNDWMNVKDPPPSGLASSKPSNSKPSKSFNWKYWINPLNIMDPLAPEARPASSNPLNSKPSTKSGFNWQHWASLLNPLPKPGWSKPLTPKPSGLGPLNPGPSTSRLTNNPDGYPNLTPMTGLQPQPQPPLKIRPPNVEPTEEPENEVVARPPPIPEMTDPELNSDPQSSNADSQPVDLQNSIYAGKGKAKQSRRISGTARDVENAAEGVAAC